MASSVNNIAATFATVTGSSSSTISASSSVSTSSLTSFPLSIPQRPLSVSWNPHTSLPKSHTPSLINLYGPPGPRRSFNSISTVKSKPIAVPVGYKLPDVTLSYLAQNGAVQFVSLRRLCKGKRVVLVGVSAAFSPSCTRFVKRVESEKSRAVDLLACVAFNDVFVMKAWGENLAVGEKVMMLSDGGGELCGALGMTVDAGATACFGLGVRPRRFCLSAVNGVVTSINFDDDVEDDALPSIKSTV
ncbi:peroxiredoxin-2E-1 chloroplastic-like [Tripterygium wilfordii]|uniref:glutaredoxin-dependent peroxiredoxin n=1 Tax=Tripterygium wilfordii TaxID=458696 RepID=A0A7J7DLA8_TRIWF|nr:peroxiredoxin-2E-1 chloroplastic-like [Tripterygium wilfordii]